MLAQSGGKNLPRNNTLHTFFTIFCQFLAIVILDFFFQKRKKYLAENSNFHLKYVPSKRIKDDQTENWQKLKKGRKFLMFHMPSLKKANFSALSQKKLRIPSKNSKTSHIQNFHARQLSQFSKLKRLHNVRTT